MKKLLAIAATLAASSAFAGVKLEVRSDYVNTPDYKTVNGTTDIGGTSLFAPNVARLYLNGNVGEAVIESAWNLRSFAPEFASSPYGGSELNKNMTVDKFVDHLWAGKAMGQWMFKAGKLETNTGGFEYQKSLHGDTYLVSMANRGVGGVIPVVAASANPYFVQTAALVANPENSSGVSAAYSLTENHKFEVQVTNQVNSNAWTGYGAVGTTGVTNTRATDRGHSYGLNYLGSFVDKMLVLNLNYTAGTADTANIAGTATGNEMSWMAASLRVAPMADLTIDLEYFGNKDKQTTPTTSNEMKTNTTLVEARYNINGWVPVLKYEMSENKSDTASQQFKREAYAVAVEYVPKADEAFRYHVGYTSVKDKEFGTTGYQDMTKNMMVVGFKYMGDMAK